jgi:Zn-dependent protease
MIRFTIFGIPVEIQPWFWLMVFFLGGGMRVGDSVSVLQIATFAVIALISILVHELGHAIVGRKLGGGRANIVLWGMGGLAYNHGGRFDRSGRMWMILAGPGAGIALGFVVVLVLGALTDLPSALGLTGQILFGFGRITPQLVNFIGDQQMRLYIFTQFIYINFLWSLINLLPVHPLDGGQFADLFIKNRNHTHWLGVICGASAAVIFLSMGQAYAAVLFGMLAFQNYSAISK